jgi:hypothetical protein
MNFVFNPFFFTSTGVISGVYNAEIFPVEILARGNSLASVSNWYVGLIIGQISPIALDAVMFRYFYAFFVFNVVAAIFYAVFYPDTKGKTLEQMDTLFGDEGGSSCLGEPDGCCGRDGGFRKRFEGSPRCESMKMRNCTVIFEIWVTWVNARRIAFLEIVWPKPDGDAVHGRSREMYILIQPTYQDG